MIELCRSNEDLEFPSAEDLRVPLRSNTDAQLIKNGSLSQIVLQSILTEVADWHLTLSSACYQSSLVGKSTFLALSIGLVDSFPHSLASELELKVIRIRDAALLVSNAIQSSPKVPERSEDALASQKPGPYSKNAIAVVGMACRFPGADSTDEFWEQLKAGTSMHSEIPSKRFSTKDHRRSTGKTYFGNFIRDVDAFDHKFFKKSSREAASTDPQQRLLLQVAYEALESSGEFGASSNPSADTGCYVGVCTNDYNDNVASHNPNAFSSLGTLRAFLTGKISHYFGWTGPSITYDTACSSSAVAIHAACKALQGGECTKAVAGGVTLFSSPYFYQNLAAASFLSRTGPTKAFDASADGYCRGEGVGLVVLKKLSDAVAAGDNVLGVISATAVNQCNNAVPITVPHSPSQTNLFKKLLKMADIKSTEVSFIEAHGTGTPVGDPLEFESIKDVFGLRSSKLHIGSVKANIGHTEGASGVAALIKIILMMKHKTIPTQVNFKNLSPKISALNPGVLTVPTTSESWKSDKLIACLNNYGAAGSISAMIVCQPPSAAENNSSRISAKLKCPIIVTAKSAASLRAYAVALRKLIRPQTPTDLPRPLLADVAFALANQQNMSFPQILATTATTLDELDDKLQALETKTDAASTAATRVKPTVLAFGGQTSRSIGLCKDNYNDSSLLRLHLDHCDRVIRSLGYEGLFPDIFLTEPQENVVRLHAMQFALQYSCAMAWIDCGLKVDRLIGHSFGQLTALTVSGSLSLVDGLRLICGRASLMQQHWGPERGTMVALEADLTTVTTVIDTVNSTGYRVGIACYNAPRSHVLVGTQLAVEAVEQYIAQSATLRGTKFKRLNVTHGFHSEFTEPILPGLFELADGLTFKEGNIPLETCSDKLSWTDLEPKRIVEHTRTPVYFGQAVGRITKELGPCTWIEAGSNTSITAMVRRALSTEIAAQHTFHTVNLCHTDAMGSLADTIVDLWKSGSTAQFWPFHRSQKASYDHFDLPPYQFEKTRHWLQWTERNQESSQKTPTQIEEKKERTLLSFVRFRDQSRKEAEFIVDPQSEQYRLFVHGHRVLAQPLFPAPLYIETVAQAILKIETTLDARNVVPSVEGLEITAPLGSNQELEIHLSLTRLEGADPTWCFNFNSRVPNSKNVQEHATGTVLMRPGTDIGVATEFDRFQHLVGSNRYKDLMANQEAEGMQGSLIYKVFSKVVDYSGYYEGVKRVSSKGGEVSGLVALPDHDQDGLDKTICNPLAMDNFIQVAGLHCNSLNSLGANEVYVCTQLDRVQPSSHFVGTPVDGRSWMVFSYVTTIKKKEITNDIFVFDPSTQKLIFIVLGARFQRVIMSSLVKVLSRANSAVNSRANSVIHSRVNSSANLAQMAPAAEPKPVDDSQAIGANSAANTGSELSKPLTNGELPGEEESKKSQNLEALKIEKDLKNLLSGITDVPVDAFKDESTLEDLGIDSLMIMEISTEIRQAFGIDIPQDDLQELTTFRKTVEYLCSKRGIGRIGEPSSEDDTLRPNELLSSEPNVATKTRSDNAPDQGNSGSRKEAGPKLAQILASHLETSPSSFTQDTNLAEKGLDSLLCIEFANDVTESLGVTVDITQLSTESTFGDLCDMVTDSGSSGSSMLTPSSAQSGASEATTVANSPGLESVDSKLWDDAPKPQAAGALVGAQQAFDAIRYDFDTYSKETGFFEFWKHIYPSQAQLVLAYVVEAFKYLGCSLALMRTGDRVPALKILPKHEKLGKVLYEILRDASLIEWTGGNFIRSDVPVDTTPASKLHQDIIDAHPRYACEHDLLDITGSKLGPALSGTADSLELLFGSKKNRDLLEGVYTNGPMYEAITRLLGSFLKSALGTGNTEQTFHILELGGGTGSTTKHVLEVLVRSGIRFTYTFTDSSPELVAAGKRKFAKYEFVSYETINIEKPPSAELLGHFHVVLSTNCVHATRNLASSLSHIRQMLRPDGFMSLVEFTKNLFWFDIIFGLLEGWKLFEDGRKHALADGAFWEKSMKAAGFKHITMTDGTSLESRTLRIITGFPASCEDPAYKMKAITRFEMPRETLAYRARKDNVLRADLYYPEIDTPKTKRPVGMTL